MSEQQDQEKNIAQGLSQLGETTTAAELLRQKGQTKKLRVISEKQLMDWILKLMQQHMAGKADAFSDIEKTELLKKTQDELGRRIKREQEAQAERDRLKTELEQAMSAVAAGSSAQSQADIDMALAALKEKLEQAEQINLDLQQDNYDLQDQLNEKMALLSTTIAEKDKLRDTVRSQMMRMTSLCEGVLGIDNDYYGSRHQEENPVPDEAGQDEAFYHDFDVGAKVITTLQADLERLRGIVKREEEQAVEQAAEQEQKKGLLEADLVLLEQLKSGSLHAVDVAAPVAGLLEAMEGARCEAESFEQQVADATGGAHAEAFTELPDAGGDPAEVLAGATGVVRELAASLARNRNRIAALKAIADESDEARHGTEEELEAVKAALEQVCVSLRQRAESEHLKAPAALGEREADPAQRAAACAEVVEHLQAASPVDAAAIEQLALTDRLVKPGQPSVEVQTTDKRLVAERLRKAGVELERYTLDLQRQLDESVARERAFAKQVRDLSLLAGGEKAQAVRELERSLEVKADPQLLSEITAKALDEVAGSSSKQASISAAFDEDKAIAESLVSISKGDSVLAERFADLAVAAEEQDPAQQAHLGEQVRAAVRALGERKRALEGEVRQLEAQLEAHRADQGKGSTEAKRLTAELEKVRAELTKAGGEAVRLRSGREAANAAFDVVASDIAKRLPDAHPDLVDRSSEPQARAAAALAAIARLTQHAAATAAAAEAVEAIDRALGRIGTAPGLGKDLNPADESQAAERLALATRTMDERLSLLSIELDVSRQHERDLARQVRDLSAALAVASPAAAPKDDLDRIDRALADNAEPKELAEATRRVVAGIKANAGKAEAQARAELARSLAAELIKASVGDASLADSAAALSVAIESGSGQDPMLENDLHEAVLKLAARKRAVEAERARLAAEVETARAERLAALKRYEDAEMARRDEGERLAREVAALKDRATEAEAEAAEFRARNEATGTQFSGEMVGLHQELASLRAKCQEQSTALSTLHQTIEAAEARLRRQREELTRSLEERDQLIIEKDRTIDQLSNQRIDAKALQAKVTALSVDLETANDRIRQLEALHGDQAGQAVRSDDLAELHRRTTAEREHLREQKRVIEASLADARSEVEQMRTELAELRKTQQADAEAHARELTGEHEKVVILQDMLRKVKEEVVGLKARQRKPASEAK